MTEKKKYETPQIQTYEVKTATIIATSSGETTQTEEYETGETTSWF